MNGNDHVHFDPATRLYVWSGPHAERHTPERAGFVFNESIRKWATVSPFIAFQLSPSLPELGFIAARLKASQARSTAIEVPCPAGRKLCDFQKAGIAYAHASKVVYFGDEPGVGKTPQIICLANLERYTNCLAIVPAHLRENWKREIVNWYIGDPRNWRVESYEYAERHTSRLKLTHYDMIAFDEAHALKETTSSRSKKILGTSSIEPLTLFGKKIVFASGTPLPNRVAEIWPVLRANAPWVIKDCLSFRDFVTRFSYFVQTDDGRLVTRGVQREEELYTRLRGSILVRRKKSDVLSQLPEKMYRLVVYPPDAETSKVLVKEKAFSAAEILRNGAPAGSPAADIRKEMAIAKTGLAARYLSDVLDGGEQKVVAFGHHRELLLALKELLARYKPVLVIGGLSDKVRQAAVDAFQNDPSVRLFLGGITACGTGVTLTAASRLVRLEGSWVAGENQQCEDRIHRMGQIAKSVVVEDLVVEKSLDAQILGCAARKSRDVSGVLDGAAQ